MSAASPIPGVTVDRPTVTPETPAARQAEEAAHRLAREHALSRQPEPAPSLLDRLKDHEKLLQDTYSRFAAASEDELIFSYAAEWLLDNYYIVQQAERLIREDLPKRFYRQLPRLAAGPLAGYPRIYAIAREVIREAEVYLDLDRARRFIQVYQQVSPLTMGELWAFPLMLRFGILECLSFAAGRGAGLQIGGDAALPISVLATWDGADDTIVANCILSLRAMAIEDWKEFFESVSLVEQILRADPSGVYSRMDFETRDRYRKVVEELALRTGRSDTDVARAAIARAQTAKPDSLRAQHIGYYLVDAGYTLLEADLGYQPDFKKSLQRWLYAHATLAYLGSAGLLTLAIVFSLLRYVVFAGGTLPQIIGAGLLLLIPASSVAILVANGAATHLISPRVLPRLDFDEEVPPEFSTMIVVPGLIASVSDIRSLLAQLEIHFLSNSVPNLYFALLTDFADAPAESMPEDDALIREARAGIDALNAQYGQDGMQPFYLFHRRRMWNPRENCWMGWERKRGKLAEFNRLLRGQTGTSFSVQVGELGMLPTIKYVITLDADTIIPRGSAQRLIATLAHPLNRAEFDPETGEIIAGYTILQPRTEIKPTSANRSLFTRIFAGDTGLDLYTLAVSDVYQDLFGEGIYVGKGIYDIDAFERGLRDRVPENALLSHDLFEGIQGRAALVTNIILLEDYPPHYLVQAARLHRWVRGDWQLLPWLWARVPNAHGQKIPTPLSAIDRWKIFDNLRRSLLSPSLLALLIAGWLWLPGSPLTWTLAGLLILGTPLFVGLASAFTDSIGRQALTGALRPVRYDALRVFLALAFLPYEALLTLNAIRVTLVRLYLSHRDMLQWVTAARTARLFGRHLKLDVTLQQMGAAPVLAIVLAALMWQMQRTAFFVAAPLLALWVLSPWIAYRISHPIAHRAAAISEEDRQQLRALARRTWLFFERFVGPEDNWLPPDNFQESPLGLVARRTSPTNIGLYLLSTLAAYDIGYIGLLGLALRLRDTFDTLDRLERYRGHFLNWYDTRSLEALQPRYVSTVDSGNLAACLLVLKQACLNLQSNPILRWPRWEGLLDTLAILIEVLDSLDKLELKTQTTALRECLASIRQEILAAQDKPDAWVSLLEKLSSESWDKLDSLLLTFVDANIDLMDVESLRGLRLVSERVHHHLDAARREVDTLVPWLVSMAEPPALFTQPQAHPALHSAWQSLLDALPAETSLEQMVPHCRAGQARLAELCEQLEALTGSSLPVEEARVWCAGLARKLKDAQLAARPLLIGYGKLIDQAEAFFQSMDFHFLYDAHRGVFHIGYNLSAGRLDNNYYDLLASEARIASIIAIAQGDVPQRHWLQLARPLTQVEGRRALLSWSGTMFEYLMPTLLMRDYPNTLLAQSSQAAIDCQIAYARSKKAPWGISESAYYAFDASLNYQYRAFGVPGLGFKRGLGEDLVIAPYASLLALPIRPHAVIDNIGYLKRFNMLGRFGLYEALDFTRSRLAQNQPYVAVRAYMAHHQGMILVSLANHLHGNTMVRRFHADSHIGSVELLLQEQIPHEAPLEYPQRDEAPALRPAQPQATLSGWHVPLDAAVPQAHFLSNGRYGVLITSAGGGYSQWEGIDLTRWRADTTLDDWGTWVYLQDRDTGRLWSAAHQPTGWRADSYDVLFYPHKAEFRSQLGDITVEMEITVAPNDDVEVRRVTLINHSDRPRRVGLTTYAEVALAGPGVDLRHPAFNKLFIESEYVDSLNALLFRRRPRSADEKPIYLLHALVMERGRVASGAHETDRARFLGRGGDATSPAALQAGGPGLSGTTGATLDPIMALGQNITLKPHAVVQIAAVTLATRSRDTALAVARRYQNWSSIDRAFDQARARAEIELGQLSMTPADLRRFQRLLSVLFYPHHALRAEPAVLAANTKDQSGLWAYGISGDYPILLARIDDEQEAAVILDLLQAHAYWRSKRLKIDLVILNQRESGYMPEVQGLLQRLIAQTKSEAWLNRRGGIFLIQAAHMAEADRILLNTTARAVVDGQIDSLDERLSRTLEQPVRLPPFVPTVDMSETARPAPAPPRPSDLLFDNGRGGFTPDGREYAIYLEPGEHTPLPWINVVANPEFGFLVSESGGGYTWAANSGENRLTPWRNDPVSDTPGEALYLRDEETAQIWSPTPLPAGATAPYLIRHGAGYSIFEHHSHGLKQRLRLFAAPGAPVKIVQLRLENTRRYTRRITATYYAEWVLGTTRDAHQPYVVPEFDDARQALLARNAYNVEFSERVAFLAASKALHGLTADRAEFLGRMGNIWHPAALNRIGLAATVQAGLDPCAAIQLHIDLPPGAVEEVYFILGQGADRAQTLQLIEQYQDAAQVEKAWQSVAEMWDEILGAVSVDTPDASLNLLLNRWLLYQSLSCRVWGRSALYQSSGAFGYRDQLQDVMAYIHSRPDIAREHILRAARHQFEAGDVLHWWHPPSGRGIRSRCSDDLLWLPFVTAHYVATTGDTSILSDQVPFLRGMPLEPHEEERYGVYEPTAEVYTLYEHCRRALKKGLTHGPHGLPLMGSGDWNDGMNRVGIEGTGESVWLGWFLYAALTQFSPLCERMDDAQQAEVYRRQAESVRQALEDHAWDGSWYRRAYYDDGTPLGSIQNRECQIDSLAQSWTVLSGAADPERSRRAMEAVAERLVRHDEGIILLFAPPFDKTRREPGYIKGYAPGIRENGGQYTHAALWAIWAFAELGQADRVRDLLRLVNPMGHSDTLQKMATYQVEPYVIAADVYSVPPHVGHGGWTWYTGSASWMYRLGLEAILGVRRAGDTLRIEPCIPADWPGYQVTYRYGKTPYHIRVENRGRARDAKRVTLDGSPLADQAIALTDDGRLHEVVVELG